MDFHTAELENRVARMQAELLGLQQQLSAARGGNPVQQQVPGLPQQEGIVSRVWRGFRAAFIAGIAMAREGWRRLKKWASLAWQTTKTVAIIAWEVGKVAAIVAWGTTKILARRAWEKVKSFSLRVWTAVRPKLEAVWVKTKEVAMKVAMSAMVLGIVVFEKAVAVSAWLSRKMQQAIEVVTQQVNRLAEFLGRMLAHGIVLGLWAYFQIRTVYEVARDTVREELAFEHEIPEERMARAAA